MQSGLLRSPGWEGPSVGVEARWGGLGTEEGGQKEKETDCLKGMVPRGYGKINSLSSVESRKGTLQLSCFVL